MSDPGGLSPIAMEMKTYPGVKEELEDTGTVKTENPLAESIRKSFTVQSVKLTSTKVIQKVQCQSCFSSVNFQGFPDFYAHARSDHAKLIKESWIKCQKCRHIFPAEKVGKHSMRCGWKKTKKTRTKKKSERANFAIDVSKHNPISPMTVGEKETVFKDLTTRCDECHLSFSNAKRRKYFDHMNTRHPETVKGSWFQCHVCSFYLPTIPIKRLHYAFRHRPLKCSLCDLDFAFEGRLSFNQHLAEKHPEALLTSRIKGSSLWKTCPTCRKKVRRLNEHVALCKKAFIKCTCKKEVTNSSTVYYSHMNLRHSDLVAIHWTYCTDCGRYYPEHFMTRHKSFCKSYPHKCGICGLRIKVLKQYYEHLRTLHPEEVKNWQRCIECEKAFPTGSLLEKHQIYCKKFARQKYLRSGIACGCEEFKKESDRGNVNYFNHMNGKHLDLIKDLWKPCKHCQKLLPEGKKFYNHQWICENKHTLSCRHCPISECKAEFVSWKEFYAHVRTSHEKFAKENWIQCNVCSRRYPKTLNMEQHEKVCKQEKAKKQIYLDKGFIKCDCDEILKPTNKGAWSYFRHMNDNHPYLIKDVWSKCQTCSKFYPAEKIHNHESYCKKTFEADSKSTEISCDCPEPKRKGAGYYIHMNSNHLDLIQDRWSKCTECSLLYPKKRLSSHIAYCKNVRPRLISKTNANATSRKKVIQKEAVPVDECSKYHDKQLRPTVTTNYYIHMNDCHRDFVRENGWKQCQLCDLFYPPGKPLNSHRKNCRNKKKQLLKSTTTSTMSDSGTTSINSIMFPENDLDLDDIDSELPWLKSSPTSAAQSDKEK